MSVTLVTRIAISQSVSFIADNTVLHNDSNFGIVLYVNDM